MPVVGKPTIRIGLVHRVIVNVCVRACVARQHSKHEPYRGGGFESDRFTHTVFTAYQGTVVVLGGVSDLYGEK
jgi:hypothetical protein